MGEELTSVCLARASVCEWLNVWVREWVSQGWEVVWKVVWERDYLQGLPWSILSLGPGSYIGPSSQFEFLLDFVLLYIYIGPNTAGPAPGRWASHWCPTAAFLWRGENAQKYISTLQHTGHIRFPLYTFSPLQYIVTRLSLLVCWYLYKKNSYRKLSHIWVRLIFICAPLYLTNGFRLNSLLST